MCSAKYEELVCSYEHIRTDNCQTEGKMNAIIYFIENIQQNLIWICNILYYHKS